MRKERGRRGGRENEGRMGKGGREGGGLDEPFPSDAGSGIVLGPSAPSIFLSRRGFPWRARPGRIPPSPLAPQPPRHAAPPPPPPRAKAPSLSRSAGSRWRRAPGAVTRGPRRTGRAGTPSASSSAAGPPLPHAGAARSPPPPGSPSALAGW